MQLQAGVSTKQFQIRITTRCSESAPRRNNGSCKPRGYFKLNNQKRYYANTRSDFNQHLLYLSADRRPSAMKSSGGTKSSSSSSATKTDRRRSSTKSPSRRGSSSKSKSPSRSDKSPSRRASVRNVQICLTGWGWWSGSWVGLTKIWNVPPPCLGSR